MRIIICDDDIELTQELKKILVSFFQKNSLKLPEISIYNNGQDLLNDTGDKGIVFLDIEMPGMNGIYIGNELKQKNKNTIIFVVTSYSQYLDEAMRFNVFRYLSKPLDKQRIFRNLQDAITLYNTSITKVSIETKDGMFIVLSTDIFFIEAHNHKTIVHTSEVRCAMLIRWEPVLWISMGILIVRSILHQDRLYNSGTLRRHLP